MAPDDTEATPTVTFDVLSTSSPRGAKLPQTSGASVTYTTGNRSNATGNVSRRSGKSSAMRSGTTTGSSQAKSDVTAKRVILGRLMFCGFLCIVAGFLGFIANFILKRSERSLANNQFESIADRALHTAAASVLRQRFGSFSMASILSNALPNSTAWPFMYFDGFEEISSNLIRTSNGRAVGMAPIIYDLEDLEAFENHAYERFSERFPGNERVGVSSFGKGVFGVDPTSDAPDKRYHDTAGNTTYGSPNRIFTPLIHHSLGAHPILLYNLHSEPTRGRIIDGIIECSDQRIPGEDGSLANNCGVISDMLSLVDVPDEPSPGALMIDPIYADDNTKLVGIFVSSILWREAFLNVFVKEVNGIDCVLETNDRAYTYQISHGIALPKGDGDLHDISYQSYKTTIRLTSDGVLGPNSVEYTLSIYPTDEFFAVYDTGNPTIATIGALCIILLTSCLFLLYDHCVQKDVSAKQELLEAKRKFVRFVSHEVRTPLNSVCMGLTLMQEEIEASIEKAEDDLEDSAALTKLSLFPLLGADAKSSDASREITKESMGRANEWLVLVKEIYANAQSSVDVLNDLLNYDKIEMGNLTLELTVVPIWKLIETTAMEFKLPATKKNIDFSIQLGTDGDNGDMEAGGDGNRYSNRSEDLRGDIVNRKVIGDAVRLTQVLRNLLSNAIKFTPDSGRIEVKASWIKAAPAKDPEKFSLSSGEDVAYNESGHLEVSVTDSGAGMSGDQLANLFKNGVQFNVNELQAGQGSGLGLFIAKGIMTQHDGTLTADSKGIGKGTIFTMAIPLFDVPKVEKNIAEEERYATANAGQAPPPLGQQLDQTQRGASKLLSSPHFSCTVPVSPSLPPPMEEPTGPVYLNILVVDDAGTNRKLLRRLLERHGHICDDAEDGQVAVDKVKAKMDEGIMYDAILLDYEMPVMNGPTAAKVMREMGCDAFIVGITGNVLSEDVSYFKSCGANGVLPKPFKMAGLDELWAEYGMGGSVLTLSNKRNKRSSKSTDSSSEAKLPATPPLSSPVDPASTTASLDPAKDTSAGAPASASLFSTLGS